MSLDNWILSLHLLGAFALAGGTVMFTVVFLALRRADLPNQALALGPFVRIGVPVVVGGAIAVLVFGVWLAISLDRYSIFDAWLIVALILWAIGFETGRRSGIDLDKGLTRSAELAAAGKGEEPSAELAAELQSARGLMFHSIATVAVFLVLVDMVWKPGA